MTPNSILWMGIAISVTLWVTGVTALFGAVATITLLILKLVLECVE